MDTFYSSVPAFDGSTCCQLYVGKHSKFIDVYGMIGHTEQNIMATLLDNIRERGAMSALISDNAPEQIGKGVKTLLRCHSVKDQQCEPHHQHQNPAERQIQEVKGTTAVVMDRSGAPPAAWLLCMIYVVAILNITPLKSLNYDTPTRVCLGHTADISHLLQFKFWERVYIYTGDAAFPGSKEIGGYYAGPAPNKGDALCSWVYTDDGQLVARSVLRPATAKDPVAALERPCGETPPLVLQSESERAGIAKNSPNALPEFDPADLIGRTFLLPRGEDGTLHRAEVMRRADSIAQDVEEMFVVRIADGKQTDTLTYDAVVQGIHEQLEREATQSDEERHWLFKEVKDHRKAGSSWEVLLKWEDDSETWEPPRRGSLCPLLPKMILSTWPNMLSIKISLICQDGNDSVVTTARTKRS